VWSGGTAGCASESESDKDRAGVHELAVVLFGPVLSARSL